MEVDTAIGVVVGAVEVVGVGVAKAPVGLEEGPAVGAIVEAVEVGWQVPLSSAG